MAEALDRCLAFRRDLARRQAGRIETTRFGEAVFEDALPEVYRLNMLWVDAGAAADADELAEDAERAFGPLVRHRRLALDDTLGTAVAGSFREAGWEAHPLLVMSYEGGGRLVETGGVEELQPAVLEPVWAEGMREDAVGDEEIVRQLLVSRAITSRAADVVHLAQRSDGEIACYCELYLHGGIGQIENVVTLGRHRGKGLASAVVTRALQESQARGSDLTFLLAYENDWPKELYRKLGFREAGRVWEVVRKPPRGLDD